MKSIIESLSNLKGIVDLSLVLLITAGILSYLASSRLYNLLKIIGALLLLFVISIILDLTLLYSLLSQYSLFFFLLIIILFQAELRHSFENIRKGHFLNSILSSSFEIQNPTFIKQLLNAVDTLSKQKTGALIVIECKTSLMQYCDSGIRISADCRSELLQSLFWPGTPTHDGAVIIKNQRLVSAACLLPLSDTPMADQRLGTRHRAAIGLSEKSDAIVIVVSEETGTISLAENGNMTRYLSKEALETRLFNLYEEADDRKGQRFWNRWFKVS